MAELRQGSLVRETVRSKEHEKMRILQKYMFETAFNKYLESFKKLYHWFILNLTNIYYLVTLDKVLLLLFLFMYCIFIVLYLFILLSNFVWKSIF